MRSRQVLSIVTLLVLTLALAGLNGCSFLRREVRLYPIEKTDIFDIPRGATVLIPEGTTSVDDKGKVIHTWERTEIPVEKQGWFVSDFWLEEVGNVKIGK